MKDDEALDILLGNIAGEPGADPGEDDADAGPLDRLRAAGEVSVVTGDPVGELPAPLPLEPGQEPPSVVLERLRRDER